MPGVPLVGVLLTWVVHQLCKVLVNSPPWVKLPVKTFSAARLAVATALAYCRLNTFWPSVL